MNSADVTDLVNYTKKITVYDDYAEFVTKMEYYLKSQEVRCQRGILVNLIS